VIKHYLEEHEFTIYAGSRCPQPGPCTPNRTEYEVINISVHPKYDICLNTTDIAVMELSQDVDENDAIPICTPKADTPLPKTLAAVGYGWDRKFNLKPSR
ncbi:hypothetical protein OESDEN_19201, partial [Oesophagostomum dentatum]